MCDPLRFAAALSAARGVGAVMTVGNCPACSFAPFISPVYFAPPRRVVGETGPSAQTLGR